MTFRSFATERGTKAVGIIPARWSSTRFPGKPLHLIHGKALLRRVWERCKAAKNLDSLIIATDDMRIAEAAFNWGAEVALTSTSHASGTDRITRSGSSHRIQCHKRTRRRCVNEPSGREAPAQTRRSLRVDGLRDRDRFACAACRNQTTAVGSRYAYNTPGNARGCICQFDGENAARWLKPTKR